MTNIDPYYVGAHEHGLIRIYAIDLPPEEVDLFATEWNVGTEDYTWSLKDWLGADPLDQTYVTAFDVTDLGKLGLVGYLRDGYDIAQSELDAHKASLESITGGVAVITSSAFGGVEQILATPNERPTVNSPNPLRHIVTLKKEGAVVTFKPLPSEGARGVIGDMPTKKRPSDAEIGGRVATVALLVMALLVWLMIWIA